MSLRPALIALALAVPRVSAQSPAPMQRLSPSWQAQWALRSRWATDQPFARGATASPSWRVPSGQVDLPPFTDGTRVLMLHAAPKKLQSLDPATGQIQWEAPFTGLLEGPPQLASDRILCPLDGGRLALLDPASGAMRQLLRLPAWKPVGDEGAPLRPRMLYPLKAGGLVVAGWHSPSTEPRPERSLFAFDAETGDLRWSAPLPSGSETHPLYHWNLVLTAGGGQATALRLADGTPAWTTRLPRRSTLESAQVIGGRLLLRTTQDITALDATTGQALWTLPLAESSLLLGSGDVLVLTATRGTFNPESFAMALDARSGRVIWEKEAAGARLPWVQSGMVLVNDGDDLLSLDLLTGRERWRKALGGALLAPLQPQGALVLALHRAKGQARISGFRVTDGGEALLVPLQDRLGPGALLVGPQALLVPLAEGGVAGYR